MIDRGKVAPRSAYGSGDAEGAPALSNHLAKLRSRELGHLRTRRGRRTIAKVM